jgi:predicted DNA-binding transcriptional regulator AlpA
VKTIEPNSSPEFLSRRQIATLLGVSTETIKRRDKSGLLKSVRLNSRLIRYPRAEVDRMIKEASAHQTIRP